MLNKLQKLREGREQGFTLIELLVVILIIGILAAIAIPAFMNQRKLANDAALQSDLSNAAKAVETMRLGKSGSDAIPSVIGENVLPLSNGTELKYSGIFDAYCITGTNEGSNHTANGKDIPMAYESTMGGLLTDGPVDGGACTASNLAPVPDPSESGGYPPYDSEKCKPSSLVAGQSTSFHEQVSIWQGSQWLGEEEATVSAVYKGSIVEGSFCYYDWEISVSFDNKAISGVTQSRPSIWFTNNRGRYAPSQVTVTNGEAKFLVREEAYWSEDIDSWDAANAIPTQLDFMTVDAS